jgi:hypothetical protein
MQELIRQKAMLPTAQMEMLVQNVLLYTMELIGKWLV